MNYRKDIVPFLNIILLLFVHYSAAMEAEVSKSYFVECFDGTLKVKKKFFKKLKANSQLIQASEEHSLPDSDSILYLQGLCKQQLRDLRNWCYDNEKFNIKHQQLPEDPQKGLELIACLAYLCRTLDYLIWRYKAQVEMVEDLLGKHIAESLFLQSVAQGDKLASDIVGILPCVASSRMFEPLISRWIRPKAFKHDFCSSINNGDMRKVLALNGTNYMVQNNMSTHVISVVNNQTLFSMENFFCMLGALNHDSSIIAFGGRGAKDTSQVVVLRSDKTCILKRVLDYDANAVCLNWKGNRVAFDQYKKIVVLDIKNKNDISVLINDKCIISLAMNKEGSVIAAGSKTNINIWDVAANTKLYTHLIPKVYPNYSTLAISPHSDPYLAIRYDKGKVQIFDCLSGSYRMTINYDEHSYGPMAFTEDSLLMSRNCRGFFVWDMKSFLEELKSYRMLSPENIIELALVQGNFKKSWYKEWCVVS